MSARTNRGRTIDAPLAVFLLALALLFVAPFDGARAIARAETIQLDEPFFVVPEEVRAAAAQAHVHDESVRAAHDKGGGYTNIEDFDCSNGSCLFTLSSTLQKITYAPVGQSCAGSTTFISRSGVSTSWYDELDHPNGFPDATGNGNGSQRLATNLQGYQNAGCDSVLEFHILFRDYTASAFSGSAIRLQYYPSQFIVSKETAGTEPPRVYLQIDYAEAGILLYSVDSHSYNSWNTISTDIDPGKTVNQVLIAFGGPATWDYPIYFDELEVFDYVGPSTSCAYNPKSIGFGNTLFPGQSSQRTFDVINTATSGALFINPSAASCDVFSVTAGGGVTYIPPGQSHKITVTFSPSSHGTYECELDLGNPSCPPYLMTGGTRANCQLPETTIDFGDLIVGAPQTEISFHLKNEGGSPYEYPGSDPLTCPGFEYVTVPPAGSVAPGDSIEFVVSFAPPDTGRYDCEATIVSDCDPVTLTGRGLPDLPCVLVPDTLQFGEVDLGDTAKMTFTIENQSYGTTIGGSFADCQGLFQFLDGRTYSLSPGQSTQMTVSYVPTTVRNDTCTIQLGLPTCPNLTFIGSGNEDAVCVVTPGAHDFGVIKGIGLPGIVDVTIRNEGGRTLTGTVPASCGPFRAVGGPVDYSLGFQQSTVIRFEFEPVVNGPVSCEYPLGNECDSLTLTGIGNICEVFETELDYAEVLLGDSLVQAFTVRNNSESPVSYSLPSACGAFTIAQDDRDFELQPGSGKEVSVWFAPDTLAFYSCTIATGPGCDSVLVSGTGIGSPECVVEPGSIDFGTIPEGGLTEDTFTIRNDGTATLTATVPASCGVFTVTNPGTIELEPGGEETFVVVFGNIENPGTYSCQLDLGGSEGCGTLPLTGEAEGPPSCLVTPPAIAFGSVNVDETAEETITIANGGGGILSGTIAAGCGPFVIVEGDRAYSLGAGQSRSFTVRFAPLVGDSIECALTLGGSCGSIDVSGFGNAVCAVDLDPPANVTEGDATVITWTSRFCEGDLLLELFADNAVCGTIGTAPVADGSFAWNAAACPEVSGDYRVRATTDENVVFLSDPFTITPGAGLNLSTDAIDFTFDPLNPEQALASDLTITNDGTGPLTWSAEPNHPAIQLLFTAGTIAPGASFDLSVVVDPDQTEGELFGEIALYTNDPGAPMTTIPVSLAVRQYQAGDVDVDDDIDIVDLAALVEHVLARALLFPTIVELGIPDVNADGFVDVSDIVRLARILLDGSFDRQGPAEGVPALTAARAGADLEVRSNGTSPGAAWFTVPAPAGDPESAKTAGLIEPGEGYDLIREQRDGTIRILAVPNGSEPGDLVLRWEAAPEDAAIGGAYVARSRGVWQSGGLDVSGLANAAGGLGQGIALAAAEPNPFRDGTTLRWSLRASGTLSIAVYDIAGRRVRTLVAGSESAGTGSIRWDGRNEAGKRVPAGTYFVRGESGGQSVTRKIVLFR
ncbi:MAG: choice-of-anchor D domain-containing protein [Gemmatimonadetes bacterium]|nr:choice-of-anchor D domain-containing protein [Gemmatimonadota bacterium]